VSVETVVCLITTANPEEGVQIARALVSEGLAACVNIVPRVRSIYRWKGELCDDEEALLLVKTQRHRVEPLIQRVKALHSYSVPEILALPVQAGSEDYLRWVGECVGTEGRP